MSCENENDKEMISLNKPYSSQFNGIQKHFQPNLIEFDHADDEIIHTINKIKPSGFMNHKNNNYIDNIRNIDYNGININKEINQNN